jgi:hypothetical protein
MEVRGDGDGTAIVLRAVAAERRDATRHLTVVLLAAERVGQ